MVACSSCSKYTLVALNSIILSSLGTSYLVLKISVIFNFSFLTSIFTELSLTTGLNIGIYYCVLWSSIIITISLIGIYGALNNKKCLLAFYSSILIHILLANIGLTIYWSSVLEGELNMFVDFNYISDFVIMNFFCELLWLLGVLFGFVFYFLIIKKKKNIK